MLFEGCPLPSLTPSQLLELQVQFLVVVVTFGHLCLVQTFLVLFLRLFALTIRVAELLLPPLAALCLASNSHASEA